jgi:hypothetical protein
LAGKTPTSHDGSQAKDVTVAEQKHLADLFEQNRSHLRAVPSRMLGSVTVAEDASLVGKSSEATRHPPRSECRATRQAAEDSWKLEVQARSLVEPQGWRTRCAQNYW